MTLCYLTCVSSVCEDQSVGNRPRLAYQRAVSKHFRNAAVGEVVASGIPGMAMRDAVWKRVCEQVAEAMRLDIARRRRIHAQAPTPLLRRGIDGGERGTDRKRTRLHSSNS